MSSLPTTIKPEAADAAEREPVVLYMEDDLGLARLLQVQLGRHGYRVDLVEDGVQGLALVGERCYQAVLVDGNLPSQGGMAVLAALREADRLLPVIMVTATGDESSAVQAMKLGASDYLVKDREHRYLDLLPLVLDKVLLGHRLTLERQRTLESIRESEERYRKLVELSPDGIVICCNSRIEFANPAALRLLRAACPDDVLGANLLSFVHQDSATLFQAQLSLMESSGVNVPWLEERFVRLDLAEFDVEVSGVPFRYRGEPAVQIIFRDISTRVRAKQLLERMAYYDQLTQLPNRALFFDRFGVQLAQAKRYGFGFALLYLDLDGFKAVNDTLGHDQGDILLGQVALRLQGAVRCSDTVARLGGDEFVVLMARAASPDDAAVVADKVIKALLEPFELAGERRRIGTSVGISRFPDDAGDLDGLLGAADRAMYQAKRAGGSGFRFSCRGTLPTGRAGSAGVG
jgi:diguanylate cyclase (GGDEF)-like protein/PAS domain S-box-containing protein